MDTGPNLKRKLDRIAVFGANARIGDMVAEYIAKHSPDTKLRLIGRKESYRETLLEKFPNAEFVVANFYDTDSMVKAFRGVNGLFIVTPDFLDEDTGMANLISAVKRNHGSVSHIVRLLADPPGMTMERVPDVMKAYGGGTTVQHLRAKKVLENSGLPITYVNIAAYFMQNFSGPLFKLGLKKDRVLSCPRNRRMAFIDTRDIGRCAGAILLSDDHRHIGQTYHLDNGQDVHTFEHVADIISEAWGEPVRYDGSDETFKKYAAETFAGPNWHEDTANFFIGYSQFEQDNQTVWRKTDICEYLTGSLGTSLLQWFKDNKEACTR